MVVRRAGGAVVRVRFTASRLMSKIIIAVILLALIVGFLIVSGNKRSNQTVVPTTKMTPTVEQKQTITAMKIESSAFQHNQLIPSKYACDGENINPPLTFSDVPADAKSLALIMDDPDAPVGTWVHWTIWNIPPGAEGIEENSKPKGIEGTTSFGKPGYGGPCPPSGTHRYFFKLYALDTTLSLDQKAKKEDLEKAMEGHTLAKSELIGLYSKK